MSSQHAVYQQVIWQQKISSIFDYTNLIIKKGLTVEEVAKERNVSVDEVKSILNVLKFNNPMLYAQVQSKLNS